MFKMKILINIIFVIMDRFLKKNINLPELKYLCSNNRDYMINYNNLEDYEIDPIILYDW